MADPVHFDRNQQRLVRNVDLVVRRIPAVIPHPGWYNDLHCPTKRIRQHPLRHSRALAIPAAHYRTQRVRRDTLLRFQLLGTRSRRLKPVVSLQCLAALDPQLR